MLWERPSYCSCREGFRAKDTLGKFMYTVVMCMQVIVAPPIVVGAWSMAFLLGQHLIFGPVKVS